jgi:hypothetical protein
VGVTVAPRSLCGAGIAAVPIAGFALKRRLGLAFAEHWRARAGPDHALVEAFRMTRPVPV